MLQSITRKLLKITQKILRNFNSVFLTQRFWNGRLEMTVLLQRFITSMYNASPSQTKIKIIILNEYHLYYYYTVFSM